MELTSKQEKFCQNISIGMYQYKAYLDAYPGFKGKISTADTKAYALLRKEKIRSRIKELQLPAIEQLEMKQVRLIDWADKVATGNLTKKEIRKAVRSNPQVLNNLLNKVLPTKSESKTETKVSGIEDILKVAKEEDQSDE